MTEETDLEKAYREDLEKRITIVKTTFFTTLDYAFSTRKRAFFDKLLKDEPTAFLVKGLEDRLTAEELEQLNALNPKELAEAIRLGIKGKKAIIEEWLKEIEEEERKEAKGREHEGSSWNEEQVAAFEEQALLYWQERHKRRMAFKKWQENS